MAYAGIVRAQLYFSCFNWTASYRLHYGFAHPPTPFDVVRASEWAATIDIGSVYVAPGLCGLRNVQSLLTEVWATALPGSNRLQHVLLVPDAVGGGLDDEVPIPSAGQSVQVEWITGQRGRGVNGRTYFPCMGQSTFEPPFLDDVAVDAADFVETVCNAHAFYTPREIGADLIVYRRQVDKLPADPLTSDAVAAVAVRRKSFAHQRRRVQWRRPHLDH